MSEFLFVFAWAPIMLAVIGGSLAFTGWCLWQVLTLAVWAAKKIIGYLMSLGPRGGLKVERT